MRSGSSSIVGIVWVVIGLIVASGHAFFAHPNAVITILGRPRRAAVAARSPRRKPPSGWSGPLGALRSNDTSWPSWGSRRPVSWAAGLGDAECQGSAHRAGWLARWPPFPRKRTGGPERVHAREGSVREPIRRRLMLAPIGVALASPGLAGRLQTGARERRGGLRRRSSLVDHCRGIERQGCLDRPFQATIASTAPRLPSADGSQVNLGQSGGPISRSSILHAGRGPPALPCGGGRADERLPRDASAGVPITEEGRRPRTRTTRRRRALFPHSWSIPTATRS